MPLLCMKPDSMYAWRGAVLKKGTKDNLQVRNSRSMILRGTRVTQET